MLNEKFNAVSGLRSQENGDRLPTASEIVLGAKEALPQRDSSALQPASSGLVFDVAKYLGYLEGTELSDKEASELLKAIWQIVVGFVDMGFGSHPIQQAMDKSKMIGRADTSPVVPCASVQSNHKTSEGEAHKRAARREGIHEPR